jgi:seryl-tRNA synthetase
MLSAKWVRDNLDAVKESLRKRGVQINLDKFRATDSLRRNLIQEIDRQRHMQNMLSKEIGKSKSQGKNPGPLMQEMRNVSSNIEEREKKAKKMKKDTLDFLLLLPNQLHPEVPSGSENVEVRKWGTPPRFDFPPQDHQRLGESLGVLDFKRAAKVTGSGFVFYRGLGARLERALINFMLDLHISQGYEELLPPFMTNKAATTGTGQLPKFKDDLYRCYRNKKEGNKKEDYYLVPTAEVPVTNFYREEILEEENLPLSYVAYTPCFRREAGTYGKKIQGIIRQHQFNKVELVKFTTPQTSYGELEKLTSEAEEVLKRLELPYRVVKLSGQELGFAAAFGYDIEVWVPSQEKFLEISTCSNFEDYQARRASIKFRTKANKSTHYLHTLNGSGLAIGRTVVAILENFQDRDGHVLIPEVLHPYMQGVKWIEKP